MMQISVVHQHQSSDRQPRSVEPKTAIRVGRLIQMLAGMAQHERNRLSRTKSTSGSHVFDSICIQTLASAEGV